MAIDDFFVISIRKQQAKPFSGDVLFKTDPGSCLADGNMLCQFLLAQGEH
jgi:hypothetical protein